MASNGTACADRQTKEGRDSRGRFVKGNRGGPGNPYARKMAALKKALMDDVQPEDIVDVAIILMLKAKQGDHAAVKLLFSYLLGLPKDQVDPDRLDQDEWQIWMESVIAEKDIGRLDLGMPIDRVNSLAAQRMVEQRHIFDYLHTPMDNGANGHGGPSANGSGGEDGRGGPSRNGSDGGHRSDGAPSRNGSGRDPVRGEPTRNGSGGMSRAPMEMESGGRPGSVANGSDGEDAGGRGPMANGRCGRERDPKRTEADGQAGEMMSAAMYREVMGHWQVLHEGSGEAYQRGVDGPKDNGADGGEGAPGKGDGIQACMSADEYRETMARLTNVGHVLQGTFLRQEEEPLEDSIARVSREQGGYESQ